MNYDYRKHPRSLVEAFGPYANQGGISEPYEPMPKADKIVLIASAIALAVVAVLALLKALPGAGA